MRALKRKRDKAIWWAASVLFAFKYRKGAQSHFDVWENVYLVKGRNDRQLERRIERLARSEETDDPTLRVNGRPAVLKFVGIRKILWCSLGGETSVLRDGTEATFTTFRVTRKELAALAAGKRARVEYL